jgi:hypothetical protein
MDAAGYHETLVSFHQTTRCYMPEDGIFTSLHFAVNTMKLSLRINQHTDIFMFAA